MTSPISGTFSRKCRTDGMRGHVAGAAGAEDRVRAVARDAEAEDVDRGARDDLVGAQVDREHGVDEAEEAAGRHRAEQPDLPRAALLGHDDAPEAAHQHHALEADVDDARALREEPAERAEGERRRVLERADEEPGRDDRRDATGSACATAITSSTKTTNARKPDLRAARHSGVGSGGRRQLRWRSGRR